MKLSALVIILAVVFPMLSHAAVLWAGGEDIDFPNGSACNNGADFRTGYARYSIYPCNVGSHVTTNAFVGGAVTSLWISARVANFNVTSASVRHLGIGKFGTLNSLFLGASAASGTRYALFKYDGTTATQLAAEAGNSLINSMTKIDMQIINYGTAATVNVYLNGSNSPMITYTGDVTAGGNTSLDTVLLYRPGTSVFFSTSEIIVADSDTRRMSLVTLAPNAAGDANTWTGAFSDVNETTINDATLISSTTAGDNFQANLTNLPAGSFAVQAVKVAARASKSTTGIASIAPGVKTNTTISVPAASPLSTAFQTVETLYNINPVTVAPWSMTEINSLQTNIQSGP